jgi:ribonuclease R
MQRACYRPDNAGHFGLASESYCHFTSPIRRYPDLVVHRAVKALLGGPAAQRAHRERSTGAIAEWGRHCSSREERSQRIEWDAQKILTFEFMRRHLGDVFEGFITGAMRRGFFVELIRYPAEGFVPAKSIEGDFFDLDEAGVALVGRRSGRTYAVGDRVRVQVERIDVLAGEMDLILVRKEGEASGGARRKGGKGAQDGKGAKRGRKNEKPYDWRKHVKKRR